MNNNAFCQIQIFRLKIYFQHAFLTNLEPFLDKDSSLLLNFSNARII